LCGYARSGKDTVARVLCEEFGFVKMAFADPLRAMALAIDPMICLEGMSPEIFGALLKHQETRGTFDNRQTSMKSEAVRYHVLIDAVGYEQAKSLPDFRRFLQRLGTEGARECMWDSIWLDTLGRRVSALPSDARVVVTDVRFPNEAFWVRSRGTLWRVDRSGVGAPNGHASEQHIERFDVHEVIQNRGTIDDLYVRVRNVMRYSV